MRENDRYAFYHPSPTRFYIRDSGGSIVGEALDCPRDRYRHRQRANAILFAGSPELLQSLKECRAALDLCRKGAQPPGITQIISRADTAIGNTQPSIIQAAAATSTEPTEPDAPEKNRVG